MKKNMLLIAILLFVSACTSPTANKPPANTTGPTQPRAAAPLTESETIAKEKEAWDSVEQKNSDAFANLLDADYVEISSDALWDRAGSIAAARDVALSDVRFSDWKLIPIDKDAVLITYKASFKGSVKGKAFEPATVRASSVWLNRAGKWLAVYHQETEMKSHMTAPP